MSFSDPVVVIGHRGAAGLSPENTLPSFRRAWALGVNAIELDVHAVENELVVIHDDTVDRTTNGRGPVDGYRLSELRALDAGGGWPIPLLREVVAELPTGVGLNIELKGAGTAVPAAAFATEHPHLELLVSSFDHAELTAFRALAARTPVAPLFDRWRDDAWQVAERLNAAAINLSRRAVSEGRVRQANERNLAVFVYTINDAAEARRLIRLGARGVFTDYPDRITPDVLGGRAPV
jgi:glycerophosphoryl diester phosphodiesterase